MKIIWSLGFIDYTYKSFLVTPSGDAWALRLSIFYTNWRELYLLNNCVDWNFGIHWLLHIPNVSEQISAKLLVKNILKRLNLKMYLNPDLRNSILLIEETEQNGLSEKKSERDLEHMLTDSPIHNSIQFINPCDPKWHTEGHLEVIAIISWAGRGSEIIGSTLQRKVNSLYLRDKKQLYTNESKMFCLYV